MPDFLPLAIITIALAALPHLGRDRRWSTILSILSVGICALAFLFVAAFYSLANALGSTSGVTTTMFYIAVCGGIVFLSSLIAIRRRTSQKPPLPKPSSAVPPQKTITLQAGFWRGRDDLYTQLLPQLGAPEWHSHSLDALRDSLRDPEMNQISPPFTIQITGTSSLTGELAEYYRDFKSLLQDLREEDLAITLEES